MKKILSYLLALALVGSAGLVSAEEQVVPPGGQEIPFSIEVSNVTSSKTSYKPGETITGSFVVENASDFDVSNLSYRIQIGDDYEEPLPGYKFPGTFVDVGDLEESFSIAKGASKTFKYSYKIPSFLSGEKLAVHIAVLADRGALLGFADGTYFRVESSGALMAVKAAKVVLSDGKSFGLGDGPTIYIDKEPKSAVLEITVQNLSKESLAITPALSVRLQRDAKASSIDTMDLVTVDAGKTKTLQIPLPSMDYNPGVYMAEVMLTGANGEQLSQLIGARYIVGGNIANIQNALADKTAFEAGDSFHFSSTITGRAPDIAALEAGIIPDDAGTGHAEITITNEKGEVVAESTETVSLSGDTRISRDYTAKAKALATHLSMRVYDDKNILISSYEADLSADYAEKAAVAVPEESDNTLIMLVGFGVVLLILILIIIAMIKKRMMNRQNMISVLTLMILGSFPLAILASCASAGVSFTSITTPRNLQVMAAGQEFYTTGAVSYNACENNPSSITKLTATFQGKTLNASSIGGTWRVGRTGGSGWYPVAAMFKAGSFTAPTAPGTYTITYNISYVAGACSGTGVAYRQIKVAVPPENLSGGGCGNGQYYCDVIGRCVSNSDSKACNQVGDYVAFQINPKIPALIGPVKLKDNLKGRPPIVNPGGSCVIDWSADFVSYDKLTVCKFSAPGINIDFVPGDLAAPTSATILNIQKDTVYKMICSESDGLTPPEEDEGVCRLNWDYKEVN